MAKNKKKVVSAVVGLALMATVVGVGSGYIINNKDKVSNFYKGESVKPIEPTPVEETLSYAVKYMVDDEEIIRQVPIGSYPIPPAVYKEGYKFLGWLYNDILVDVTEIIVNRNFTLVASFARKCTINYTFGEETKSFTILEGEQLKMSKFKYSVPDGYDFDGWTLDGKNVIDITELDIHEDIALIAKLTQVHSVTYSFNGHEQSSYVRNGEFAEKTLDLMGYKFLGWTLDGENVIDLTTYPITQDTIFIAKLEEVENVVLNLEFTEEQKAVILRNGKNTAKGGANIDIALMTYERDLGHLNVIFNAQDKTRTSMTTYFRVPIEITSVEELTADYIYEIFNSNIETKQILSFYEISHFSSEYYQNNISSVYEINGVEYSIEEIKINLSTSRDGDKYYLAYDLFTLKDNKPTMTSVGRTDITISSTEELNNIAEYLPQILDGYKN